MRLPFPKIFAAALTLTAPIVALADCSNPATAKASVDQIIALNNDIFQAMQIKGPELQKVARKRFEAGELPIDFNRRLEAAMQAPNIKALLQEVVKNGQAMEAIFKTFDKGDAPPDYQKACEALPQLKALATKYKADYDRWLTAALEVVKSIK